MERLHSMQLKELQECERQAQLQQQRVQQPLRGATANAGSLPHGELTMEILLATLQTVLRTLHGVAAKLPAGDAKSDLLTLTDMMVPINALAGEIAKPQNA